LVVRGLERVGDEPAVEALLSALADNYGDIAALARRALTRMQERISNPKLREMVKRELEKEPPKGPSSQH
jgi:HEAT repeat protein